MTNGSQSKQEYFSIRVAGEVRIAVSLQDVESVVRMDPQRICPIPGVAPYLLGVVNQNGSLTWVLHLSQFLELSPQLYPTGTRLQAAILASHQETGERGRQERRLACLVTELEGIFSLDPSQMRPFPRQVKGPMRQLFSGMASRVLELSSAVAAAGAATLPAADEALPARVAVLDTAALFAAIHPGGFAPPQPLPSPSRLPAPSTVLAKTGA